MSLYTQKQIDRFMDKVEMIPFHSCWEWNAVKRLGYGRFRINNKLLSAHRMSLEIYLKKKVPPDLVVMHKCDNRGCVNPDHLRIGTQLENVRDSIDKGRFGIEDKIARGKARIKYFCFKGHPISGSNLTVNFKTGRRRCLKCCAERNRKYAAAARMKNG